MQRVTIVVVTIAMLSGTAFAWQTQPTNGLNEQGFITTWLLLAPIPLDESLIEDVDSQPIKDEAKLAPKAGDKVMVGNHELVWKEYKAKDYFFDFHDFLGSEVEYSVGYAVCYVHAEEELKDIKLKTASDDEVKVYLNGKEVVRFDQSRPLRKDDDAVVVSLAKGANVLVFKVVNEAKDWSGCARFTNKFGQPIKSLKV
ncbi:MAG TPA: hypothetical protein VGX78_16650, partial [Pirellulales bacterium]|nr:hypothetical protein [Pirellulales bacterium]